MKGSTIKAAHYFSHIHFSSGNWFGGIIATSVRLGREHVRDPSMIMNTVTYYFFFMLSPELNVGHKASHTADIWIQRSAAKMNSWVQRVQKNITFVKREHAALTPQPPTCEMVKLTCPFVIFCHEGFQYMKEISTWTRSVSKSMLQAAYLHVN